MIKNFSGSGLTAAPTSLQPPYGKKWKILNGYISMVTSATVGSRQVFIYSSLNSFGSGPILIDTGAQTAVSTKYVGGYAPTGSYGFQNGGGKLSTFSPHVTAGEFDILTWYVSLQSGDTFSYYLEVEESEA